MANGAETYLAGLEAGWKPEPELTVTEWADATRMLSGKASAEPGFWRTSRTPYLAEIMDCLSPSSPVQRIVFMKGAQLGATECGNNWLGFIIDQCPGPALMVQPTVEVAKRVSKQRIDPMIEATPSLRAAVQVRRARDAGNTVFVKEFQGGLLIMTGSNSAAGLRSMPIRFLFADEIDEYPDDVGGQGDPVALAEKRTTTFARRKVFLVSTPTLKDLSRIEREFLRSDQRRFFLPCPLCGNFDWIRWENIRWDEHFPETAALLCLACGELIEERHKPGMLAGGQWRPTAEKPSSTVGFHLSGLYSPLGWKSWAECAAEFLDTKADAFRFKTWVNTVLGETWEERGDRVTPGSILERAERYPAEVPRGVGVLVASVDVQGDRLEAQVKGYGAGEESWLIAFSQIHGDPGREQVWFDLDKFLLTEFRHESGQMVKIECVTIDSGGHHTEEVYRFVRVRLSRRVFAVRGGNIRGAEVVSRPSQKNRYRVKLFTLCTDTAKDIIMSRLRIRAPGPGFMHLPEWVDEEYVAQLTAEKAVRRWQKNRGTVREWVKIRERNEALDLEVYSLAALYILGPALVRSLPERAAKLAVAPAALEAQAQESPAGAGSGRKKGRPKGSNWVSGW